MATIATTPKGGTVVYIKEGDATRLPKYRVSEDETLVLTLTVGGVKLTEQNTVLAGVKSVPHQAKVRFAVKLNALNLTYTQLKPKSVL